MQHVRPRTCLSINITVMRVLGLWFPEEKNKTWRSRLYILHAILAQGFLFYLYLLSEIINMLTVFGDVQKMAEVSFLLLTHVAEAFKNYYFYKNSKKMVQLLDDLEQDIFKPKNDTQKAILNWAMRRAKSDSIILLSMAFATCALWGIFPFIEKTNDTTRLPLSGWYPFDLTKFPYFELIFCYQIIGVTANAFTNISMDTTATGLFVHICGQIDMLYDSLENMKRDAMLALITKKQNDISYIGNSFENTNLRNEEIYNLDQNGNIFTQEELESEMMNAYKRCILHHEEIIRYAEDIEDIFNMCFLAQFSASVIIICLTLFKISLVSTFVSIEFVSMVLYQGCIVFELLLYCWHGNEMILKSEALSDAVYKSAWYEFSPKFSRGIILLMVRSKRPIRATSGKFFLLSLSTFTAILRCSWSYFAVLHSMHDEEQE